MIKDGNYYYLNFDEHREKFIKVFTEYYGPEFAEIVRKRMDTITYVPYTKFDVVSEYFGKQMDKYRNELLDAFSRLSGRTLTDEQKDIVWKDGGSMIFAALNNGENLKHCDFLFEMKEEFIKHREKVANSLGYKDSTDVVADLQKEARFLREALLEVEKQHPCDVFSDLEAVVKNRNHALQSYLIYLHKHTLSLTDKDLGVLSKPTFDTYDRENLDCKYLLFGSTIEEPGLISCFTTENVNKAIEGTNLDKIRVYEGQVKYFALNAGYDKLKYVTLEELYDKVEIKDPDEYLNRLLLEEQNLMTVEPSNTNMTTSLADNVEALRKTFALGIFSGTKMCENLNRSYDNITHEVSSDNQWVTAVEYANNEYNKPINIIFFNEDQKMYNRLIANLIHEINHAIGHGKAILDKSKKLAIVKSGLMEFIREVHDSKYLGKYYEAGDTVNQVGEDFNERMSKELLDLYLTYFDDIYEESDVGLEQDENFDCAYDYYNFMTDRMWEKFKNIIKRYRIREDAGLYYDINHHQPLTISEGIATTIDYVVKKHLNPRELQKRGDINGRIFMQLGELVNIFQAEVLDDLCDLNIKPDDLRGRDDFSDLSDMTDDLNNILIAYKVMSDQITDNLIDDREDLRGRVDKQLRARKRFNQIKEFIRGNNPINITISPKNSSLPSKCRNCKNRKRKIQRMKQNYSQSKGKGNLLHFESNKDLEQLSDNQMVM